MEQHRFTFVLEQTLGNAVHGQHLARTALADSSVTANVIEIHYSANALRRRLPILGNWTVEASWRARRGVLRQLHGAGIDALFVQTMCPAQLLPDVMRRVPTVVSIDATPLGLDTFAAAYEHRARGRRAEEVKRKIAGAAFRHATVVRTWSYWAAESLTRDYGLEPERVRVIYPGVQVDRFAFDGEKPLAPSVRLLFVGGDFVRKGGPDLLAAFGRLGPGFELDVVTSRPVGQVPTDVRVHTGLTHASPELFELYRRADVFVLPTRADTLGLVFAEALAAGLPVIGCDVGAARELVIPGKTGLLVAPGSPDELAAAIRTLADSPELRARMGAHGRTLARTQHCADRNCAAVIDLLRDVSKPIPEGVTRNSRMRRWHAGEISPEAAAFDAQ